MHRIIDVSKHNGPINWQAVKDSGVIGTYIRAVDDDGVSPDPMFAQNWRGAKEAGLSRGFYSLFYGWLDPTATAKNAVKIVRERSDGDWWMGEWRPALDVEDGSKTHPVPILARNVSLQLETLERETFIQPLIYTSKYFWSFIDPNDTETWASQYALWNANYVYDPEVFGRRSKTWKDFPQDFRVAIPAVWKTYTLWQWVGDAGMNEGVDTACDLDTLNGEMDDVNVDEILGYKQTRVELPFDSREMDGGVHEQDPLGRFAEYLREKLAPLFPKKQVTNQQVINAFWRVYGSDYWNEMVAVFENSGVEQIVASRDSEFQSDKVLPESVKKELGL